MSGTVIDVLTVFLFFLIVLISSELEVILNYKLFHVRGQARRKVGWIYLGPIAKKTKEIPEAGLGCPEVP